MRSLFHPPAYPAHEIAAIQPERFATDLVECICGNTVPLRDTIGVFTCRRGSDHYSYFPACKGSAETCITAKISMGAC